MPRISWNKLYFYGRTISKLFDRSYIFMYITNRVIKHTFGIHNENMQWNKQITLSILEIAMILCKKELKKWNDCLPILLRVEYHEKHDICLILNYCGVDIK